MDSWIGNEVCIASELRFEDDRPLSRRAEWYYLGAAHLTSDSRCILKGTAIALPRVVWFSV